jgi:hypothetical protein
MHIRPILQALVLADHIYIDAKSGKKIIAGTFNHLASPTFPSFFGRPTFAFLSLTDVHGSVTINLKYVDLANNEVLMEMRDLELESPGDPLATVEMVVELPRFPMPHPGVFAFEVYAFEEPIGSLRIHVSHGHHEDRNEPTETPEDEEDDG